MLVLVAGEGALPHVIKAQTDAPLILAALEDVSTDLSVDLRFRLETLGSFIDLLKSKGATQICFAGGIARPQLDESKLDEATVPLLHRILHALQLGDDGALREVLTIFEEDGIAVVGAHEIAPDLLAQPGIPTKAQPSENDKADTDRALQIMAITSAADIGQGCVVSGGQALAIETLGGTDWMLQSLADNRPKSAKAGGVFVKAPKPNQDRRVDLPVIGPETITAAAKAGLNGVVIEAGGVMILSKSETIAAADADGLFLWVKGAE